MSHEIHDINHELVARVTPQKNYLIHEVHEVHEGMCFNEKNSCFRLNEVQHVSFVDKRFLAVQSHG